MKIKIYFFKSFLIPACFFAITAFSLKADKNNFFNNAIVKIEQENNALSVSVKTTKYNKIEFYMFTIEGKLIKELSFNESKKISITQLERGIYMYEFFSNDERLKSGQIELK